MRLDDRTVRGLPLVRDAGKADVFYWDDTLSGLGIRVRDGKRTWVCQYRVGRRQRRHTLGAVAKIGAEVARKAARKHFAQVTLGNDPAEQKRRERKQRTFASVAADFLEVKKNKVRPRTLYEIKYYLLGTAWKPFHGQPLNTVKREAIAARLRVIAKEQGPVAAARAHSALSGLGSWAVGEGLADSNPIIGANKPPEPKPRDRVLDNDELVAIWNECRDTDYGRALRLLILTGQRRGEVGGMAWSEIDLGTGLWEIPAERAKNGRPHTIPLPDPALAII